MKFFKSPLFWAIVAGTLLRLWLSLTTYGTNDVRTWQLFLDTLRENGLVDVYRLVPYCNHPPLMMVYLWLIDHLVPYAPNGFPFLMRLPAILADIGSTLLVYRLISHYWDRQRALFSALLVILSPVLILVSGFHGNTDPVYIFLILLATERFLLGGQVFLSGLILGLSMNIKIVPIVTIPLFFFFANTHKKRALFLLGLVMVLVLGYSYHLSVAFDVLVKNVIRYGSKPGVWGITQIVFAFKYLPLLSEILKGAILVSITLKMFTLSVKATSLGDPKQQSQFFLKGLGWTFLLFLIWSPGFGVQYLAWLVPTTVFLNLKRSLQFNLLAGFFMFSVYNNWCDGFPWTIAESVSWNPFEFVLCLLLWIYLVVWGITFRDRKTFATIAARFKRS